MATIRGDSVTIDSGEAENEREKDKQSLLPFAEGALLSVRLLPAEFSRIVGVSKQTVSRWVRAGKVTLGVDGRLDPAKAMRELLSKGDPGRFRARLFRQAISDVNDLRANSARAGVAEQELEAEQKRVRELETRLSRLRFAFDAVARKMNALCVHGAYFDSAAMPGVMHKIFADAQKEAALSEADTVDLRYFVSSSSMESASESRALMIFPSTK